MLAVITTTTTTHCHLLLLQAATTQQPFDKTYATVIKACGKLGLWEKALELKNQITGRMPSRIVYNNLLMTLGSCNQLAPALEVKAEMEAFGVGLDGYSYFALLINSCNVGLLDICHVCLTLPDPDKLHLHHA